MATLASVSRPSTDAPRYPPEVKKPAINWLQRLGGYKLVYWRLGNDLFALREQLEKTKAKLAKLDQEEDQEIYDDLLVYQVNLETRQKELLKRKALISKRMRSRSLDSLNDKEWQWWCFMEPAARLEPIPEHFHYWLGTTAKNSVNYERIKSGKKNKKGLLLWEICESTLPEELTYPLEAMGKEYAFEPGSDVNDVQMEYWWGGLSHLSKKAG